MNYVTILLGIALVCCVLCTGCAATPAPVADAAPMLPLLELTATPEKVTDISDCVAIRFKLVETDPRSGEKTILAAPAVRCLYGKTAVVELASEYQPTYTYSYLSDGKTVERKYAAGIYLTVTATAVDDATVDIDGSLLVSDYRSHFFHAAFSYRAKYGVSTVVCGNRLNPLPPAAEAP